MTHRKIIATFVIVTAGYLVFSPSKSASNEVDKDPANIFEKIDTKIPEVTFSTENLNDLEPKKNIKVASEKEATITTSVASKDVTAKNSLAVFKVPFYSQFTDISSPEWKKIGCGIASLAMLIEFYEPGSVTVDALLKEGIASGAYLSDAGWTHSGLINLSKKYGLGGASYDMATLSMDKAFSKLEDVLSKGPVMVSVHYTFDPQNPIPHLVVVNGVSDGKVYYNDPAEKAGGGSISITKFQSAWKKRYIEIREV